MSRIRQALLRSRLVQSPGMAQWLKLERGVRHRRQHHAPSMFAGARAPTTRGAGMTILPLRQAALGGSDGAPEQVGSAAQKVGSVRPVSGPPAGLDRPLGRGGIGQELAGVSGQDWQPEPGASWWPAPWPSAPAATTAPTSTRPSSTSWSAPGICRAGCRNGSSCSASRPCRPLCGGPAGPRQPPRGGGTPVCDQPLPLLGDLLDRKTLARPKTSSSPARIRDPAGPRQPRCFAPWASWGATTCTS